MKKFAPKDQEVPGRTTSGAHLSESGQSISPPVQFEAGQALNQGPKAQYLMQIQKMMQQDRDHQKEHGVRTRRRHALSSGESDNEDMGRAFRSLRDEENPVKDGLQPPNGHDKDKTARDHISAGSKAIKKSRYISGSRSKKVAGAWAARNKHGRVAEYDIPGYNNPEYDNPEYYIPEHDSPPKGKFYDLTRPSHQKKVFPAGKGSSLNTAKASQEVVVADKVPPSHIRAIYKAELLSEEEYKKRKDEGVDDRQELFRSRTKTKENPVPFALHEVYNREEESQKRLEIARRHWKEQIKNTAIQTNNQYEGREDFNVHKDDVREFVSRQVENPHDRAFIENDNELDKYLKEIDQAIAAYVKHVTNR